MKNMEVIQKELGHKSPVFLGGAEADFYISLENGEWWKAGFKGSRRVVAHVWVHTYDFASGPCYPRPDLLAFRLPGNPRIGNQLVVKIGDQMDKFRRRIEDRLRKGTDEDMFRVAEALNIDIV